MTQEWGSNRDLKCRSAPISLLHCSLFSSFIQKSEINIPNKDVLELLASSSNGDIRSCINSLQFYCTDSEWWLFLFLCFKINLHFLKKSSVDYNIKVFFSFKISNYLDEAGCSYFFYSLSASGFLMILAFFYRFKQQQKFK